MRLFTIIVLTAAIFSTPWTSSIAKENWQYNCSQEKWKGNQKQFVEDMFPLWREDYGRLSAGEIRLKVREILLGLQEPGQRYIIETMKKGRIVFENVDGVISCNIERQ